MAARFWVGGSGTWDNTSTANWSATSGGASGASAPIAGDSATFDANSGTAAVVTVAATATATTVTINKADITLSLSGSPTIAGTTTLTTGSVVLNSFTYTTNVFSTANSNARTVNFGTGKIVLTGTSGTIWNASTATNLTISGEPLIECPNGGAGTRTLGNGGTAGGSVSIAVSYRVTGGADTITANGFIKNLDFTGFSGTFSNSSRTIIGSLTVSAGMTLSAGTATTTFAATSGAQNVTTAGKTFDFPLTFNGIGGTFSFLDALTQGSTRNFTLTNGTVRLKEGVTSVVGVFLTSGTNQKFLQSGLTGTQATLSQASGTVNASNLTVQDINAIGGASWNAYVDYDNDDAGNNDGWNFGLSPPYATYEPPIIIRSFTQPRRF